MRVTKSASFSLLYSSRVGLGVRGSRLPNHKPLLEYNRKRMPALKSNRPINLPLSQVISVNRSPIAIASILHRISGIILFLLIPVMLWLLQNSLASPESFETVFDNVLVRFLAWIFVAAIAYHFVMGMKHLFADMGTNEEFKSASTASIISFVIAAILIAASFVWVMF